MKVSIILPTYNGSKLITNAINSVLEQSFADYEFIIIDDGSIDNTSEIIKEYASLNHRIRFYRNETNQGFEKTLNKGLRLATGKYIARIDDDDVWIDQNKLALQVEFLESHPRHVLVGTGCIIVDEHGHEIHRHSPPESDSQIRKIMLSSTVFYHSTVMFPRDLVVQLGGYREGKYHAASDYDLWLRLGNHGLLANLPNYAVFYSLRPGNMCSQHNLLQLRDIIIIIYNNRGYYNYFYYSLLRRCFQYLVVATIGYSQYPKLRKKIISGINNSLDKLNHFTKTTFK